MELLLLNKQTLQTSVTSQLQMCQMRTNDADQDQLRTSGRRSYCYSTTACGKPAMLSESFIASFLTAKGPPSSSSSSSAAAKDAGICITEFQPSSSGSGAGSAAATATAGSGRTSLKNSSTEPNCLAVSSAHVFAAQPGKAVVHVYSRERGNQEATVPFPERIRSAVVAGGGEGEGEGEGDGGAAIVILGTEGGKVIIWEVSGSLTDVQALSTVLFSF